MAEDLRDHGIRVSVICPGSVATEFSGRGSKDAGKALQPEDVAHAVQAVVTPRRGRVLSEIHGRDLRKRGGLFALCHWLCYEKVWGVVDEPGAEQTHPEAQPALAE